MKFRRLFFAALLLAIPCGATPPNEPALDGRPLEYDAGDLRGTYTGGGGTFLAGNLITNLYATWDADYLYIALQGYETGPNNGNKLVVLVDVDPTNNTGATTTTNWSGVTPDFIRYNDVGWRKSDAVGAAAFGLDYMIASEGFYNSILRITYDGDAVPSSASVTNLFDSGNGATPLLTPVDMAVQEDGAQPQCDLQGFEAKIPWSVLYAGTRFGAVEAGETVPRGATLRLIANIHNNDPAIAYSASDAIPQQTGVNASWAGGLLTSDDYVDVVVDGNDNGLPDLVLAGDVNPPYIRHVQGVQGQNAAYAQFNEPVQAASATTPGNWAVNGGTPASVTMTQTNAVLLQLTNALPAAGSYVTVRSTNVRDASGNSRYTYRCLVPTDSGLTTSVTVRFLLETASGLGVNPGATNFFINGGGLPLEFGFPPSTSSPLSPYSGTVHYRDVQFPPGTPLNLNYKFSGVLAGTNTYEAIRLSDYANTSRMLTLDTNGGFMVVTDYLGAAAAPYAGYNALYADPNRGDAGVRQRTRITFQLDLRSYNRTGLSRVLLQGSDPLRGFNLNNEDPATSDYATAPLMSWSSAGLTLYDDGNNGDATAGDGIYARQWVLTADGKDSEFSPDFPYSLVGRGEFDPPYYGNSYWVDRRSPRSLAYKFYVVKGDGSALASPAANIEYYIQGSPTNIVLPPFAWDNADLPPPPPTNSPTMGVVSPTGANVRVHFSNLPSESAHGVQISTNLLTPWLDYGLRATGVGTNWTALVQGVGSAAEFYRAFSGPAQPFQGVFFDPNPLPSTGGTLRIWYNQHSRTMAGYRNVGITGNFLSWGNAQPMIFLGDGVWYYELLVTPAMPFNTEFKARSVSGDWDSGGNYYAYKGAGRATWTPNSPTNGELFTIVYDANGGPLTAATNVNAYIGYEEAWFEAGDRRMTNTLGNTNVWTLAFEVPTNRSLSVNFVFNNGAGTWDSKDNPATGGRENRAFISPTPYP